MLMLVWCLSPNPQPSHLLLAPKAIRPGVPTSVSVTILTASPVTVSAHILHDNQTVASNSTTVEGGETCLCIINKRMYFDHLQRH